MQKKTVKTKRIDAFKTSIMLFEHPNEVELNKQIFQVIETEMSADSAGISRSNGGGTWHSKNDLHIRPGLSSLLNFINSCALKYKDESGWDISDMRASIQCWAMVTPHGGYAKSHVHPYSHISGTYYVQVNEQSGSLVMEDPRGAAPMVGLPNSKDTEYNIHKFSVKPQNGLLVLFPSWLSHYVQSNESELRRISVAFNITFFPKNIVQKVNFEPAIL